MQRDKRVNQKMITFVNLSSELEQTTDTLLKAIEQDNLKLALQLVVHRQALIDKLKLFNTSSEETRAVQALAAKLLSIDENVVAYLQGQKMEVECLLGKLNSANKAVKKYINVSEG